MRQETSDDGQHYTFGELLKTYRKEKRVSQQAIAGRLGVHRNTILKWERGDCLPVSKTLVLEAARQLQLAREETRRLLEASLTALTPYWYLPYQRNPFFTGREETLFNLSYYLLTTGKPDGHALVALTGMGGMGKTQTAIEYAYRYTHDYSAIFWIHAETPERLLFSLTEIANTLKLAEAQAQEQHKVMTAVTGWLAQHRDWLLILDNLENVADIQPLLAAARHGAILCTTRTQAPGITTHVVKLEPLTQTESIRFLYLRTGLSLSPHQPEQENTISAEADRLAQTLERLPLALDQAGAYIDETGCSISDYMQRYQQQRKHLLARRGLYEVHHPASVTTTVRLAIQHIETVQPATSDLLRLCALLQAEAIPEEILMGATVLNTGSHLDPYRLDQVLAALRSASLITRNAAKHTISLHRLVQAVLQDSMPESEQGQWQHQAIYLLNQAFPEGDFERWDRCERYLPHALALIAGQESAKHSHSETGELLYKTGNYLLQRGRYPEAETLISRGITLTEKMYGRDHPRLIPQLLAQAEVLWRQGKCSDQPPLYKAIELARRHLERSDPQFAQLLNALAMAHWSDKEYEQATNAYQEALEIHRHHHPSDNPDTAVLLHNLASVYRDQGQYTLAEPLYRQALLIHEQMESEHPQTGALLQGLATLYARQEQYETALYMYQRALTLCERHLGISHPRTREIEQEYDHVAQRVQHMSKSTP